MRLSLLLVLNTLLAGCSFALAGCQTQASPGDSNHPEDDHAAHLIPAHKPKDFPSAVARLRELNGRITSKFAGGGDRSLIEDKTLPQALDIANWLPEIAADSDMPELPWNEVAELSKTLVEAYGKLRADAGAPNRTADLSLISKTTETAITSLESILKAADPRWFPLDKSNPEASR